MNILGFLTSDEAGETRDRIFSGYEAWLGVPQAEAAQAEAEALAAAASAEGGAQAVAVTTAAKIVGGVALVGILAWYAANR
ncbi:MAG: hypothetical protein GY953_53715 [bacterium]|nr:hypothetical protein [bacterium]